MGWAVDEWDRASGRGEVQVAVNGLLLAALSLFSVPPPYLSSSPPNSEQTADAALALLLATLPTFAPSPATIPLPNVPHRAALALRAALKAGSAASGRLLTLLEAFGDVGGAAEGELVEAVAEGEVGEGTEVERRVLKVLAGREGAGGLLEGL